MKLLFTVLTFYCLVGSAASQPANTGIDQLSYLIGKWRAVTKNMTKSGVWKEANTDTVAFKFIKKEKYILAEIGGQYDYELIFSYDQFQQKFRMSSIDQVSGLLDIYEGAMKDEKLVIDNIIKDTYYTIGDKRFYNRLSLSRGTDKSAKMLIEASNTGGKEWQEISMVEFFKL